MTFTIIEQTDPDRGQAEETVRAAFARQYGASVGEFAPTLVALRPGRGDIHRETWNRETWHGETLGGISCVAGIRFATDGFFSERYLDQPIETLLRPLWNAPVRREHIAEVTNLAGMKPRSSQILIAYVIHLCRQRSIQWAFFTAGERLRAALRRAGILTLDLGPALPERMDNPDAWGTYYATNPHVVAIHDSMVAMRGIPARDERTPPLLKDSALA
ncbi:thermostable hemolysin [Varunaivibrio sulfuroxidans]|uniref:Thermostable hemolysin n=1 Tax=Varunaivibrio sulfuroxidans TaxID=1773489 RepID=A0A4R3JFD1_9PROT|nr:thermostable hemolysin [Varunaivibrio sulfuroxidans]TCS63390.1 thermostable hemolysin [Varunaivibrio sulfuroxidans]WES30463.1 thermostable hemolysin [Varunaivibrio sulfuroxidans]